MRQNKGIWIDFSDRERFCADAKAFLRPRGGLGGGVPWERCSGEGQFSCFGGPPQNAPRRCF